MLQALNDIDPNRAASVLSLAARRFLPQPGEDPAAISADQDAAERVIAELSARGTVRRRQAQAGVDPAAIQEEISREISAFFLSGIDQQAVRARVGNKGALSPSLYEVSFSQKFENGRNFWGLSKNNVVNAIVRCDQVQHFTCKIEGPNAPTHVSLFSQIAPVKRDYYTTLVRCQRVGAVLIVDEAYRVYHSDVDLVGTASAFDLLVRFIEKFGVEAEVSVVNEEGTNIQPPIHKLLYHEEIFDVDAGESVIFRNPAGSRWKFGPFASDGPMELTLAFYINIEAYAAQLARHGVRVEIPQQPLEAFTVRSSQLAAIR
jgi:hypothetical protein